MSSSVVTGTPKPHFFYADVLRVIAIFAVVILHNATSLSDKFGHIAIADWRFASAYYGLCRFCVPMFVLLSGSLLLNPNKDVTVKDLFTRRLPKLVVPLLFWSVGYMLFDHFFDKDTPTASFVFYLKAIYSSPLVFHFWFLYMMTGVYLVYPIINVFIKSATKTQVEYFIVLWFVSNSIFSIIEIAFEKPIGIELNFFMGYIGYFILGYYLKTYSFSKLTLRVLYIVGAIALIASAVVLTLMIEHHVAKANDIFESDFTPELPFAITGMFLYLKNKTFVVMPKPGWLQRAITSISNESYGIYIIHVLAMQVLFDKSLLYLQFDNLGALFSIPLKALIAFCLSYLLVRILKQIPLMKYTL